MSNVPCGFLMNILRKGSDLPFSSKSDCKEKRVVLFWHDKNIICGQTQLDDDLQTIICRRLFAGHKAGSRPMKGKTACKESSVR